MAEAAATLPIKARARTASSASGLEKMLGLVEIGDRTYRVARNSMLLRANDPATGCLQVIEGWAIRYTLLSNGQRQILSILLPGDITGLEFFASRPASYWVQATTMVSYRVFPPERISNLVSSNHAEFVPKLIDFACSQRAAVDDWLACIGACNAEQRVIFLFLHLHARLTALGLSQGNSYEVYLTQQQMADALGLNLIHFHRVLGRLHVKRLLSVADRQVVLHDLVQLRTLCPVQSHAEPSIQRSRAFQAG